VKEKPLSPKLGKVLSMYISIIHILLTSAGIQHILHRRAGLVRRGLLILLTLLSSPVGYSDEKVSRLTKEALASGFNHFKMKVGTDLKDDLRRGKMIRSIIDDPAHYPSGFKDPSSPELVGKNAGPTGAVLMIDANQVWDVPQAIEYVAGLAEIKPWSVLFISSFHFSNEN
jgi:L-alanine-DL-glutamate epimerase-like enolase superfamily enzyme